MARTPLAASLLRILRRSYVGAAVDGESSTGYEAAFLAREPCDKRGDVARLGKAGNGHETSLRVGVLTIGGIHIRVGRPGMHDVGGDAARPEIARHTLGEAD